MKNKYKLILGIIVIIVATSGYLFKADITSFLVSNPGGFDDYDPSELPKTDNRLLTAPVSVQDMGGDQYALIQKYKTGDDKYCIRDCVINCQADELELYKAYVQSYGTCMCKCISTS
jgi:hypothetical protein